MTWLRIDEDTYIDNSLVTCAEYQLFIDEMREQRKYYQPDHWTSYQFPEGRARKPVLGVRYSDAIAFCEWLTKRDGGKRSYRLPIQEDVNVFPFKSVGAGLVGHWIDGYEFTWVGIVPQDARRLALEQIHARVRSLDPALEFIELEDAFERNQAHALAIDRGPAFELFKELYSVLVHTGDLDRVRDSALHLDQGIEHIRARGLSHDYISYLDLLISDALHFALTIVHAPNSNPAYTLIRKYALDTYIDLFTIQERIAGRSPAFEGIRLVKERIR